MPGLPQYNNFRMKNTLPLDAKYKNGNVAYASVSEACSLIPVTERGLGLTVMVGSEEYWWKIGTTNADLIVKSSGGGGGGGGGDIMNRTIAQLRTESSASTTIRYQITDTDREGLFYYDTTDTTSVDNGATVIVSGSKRFKRIFEDRRIFPEWWGAVKDGQSSTTPGANSSVAFDAMFRWMEQQPRGQYIVAFKNHDYYFASQVDLPKTLQTLPNVGEPYLLVFGWGVTLRTAAAINIWNRMPANDADVSLMNNNYKLVLHGLNFQGDRTSSNQNGLRLACNYGGIAYYCQFNGLDKGVLGYFLTEFKFEGCRFGSNKTDDLTLQSLSGVVGAQTGSGSASNDCEIYNCRFFKQAGSNSAIKILSSDNPVVRHCVIEGAQSTYGIYIDTQALTTFNSADFEDIWFEQNSGSTSTNFRIISSGGMFSFSKIHRTYPDTVLDVNGSSNNVQVILDRWDYGGNMATIAFKAGGTNWSGNSINVHDCNIGFTDAIFDPARWEGSVLPQNITTEYFASANGGYTLKSSGVINILARTSAGSPVDRYINIDSNLSFITDDQGSIGGQFTNGTNRPKAVHVGTIGIYIDNAGKLRWGRAGSVTPDVVLGRPTAGVLQIESTGALQMPYGTTAQRPAASGSGHTGRIRYNTDTGSWEFYDPVVNQWGNLATVNPYNLDPNFRYLEVLPDGTLRNRKLAGLTTDRPNDLTINDKGFKFFDTSLTPARYVFWNGTQWIVPHVVSFTGDFNDLSNKPSFSTESNTYAFTLTANGNQTIPFEAMLETILIKPATDLAALKIGTLSDAEKFLAATLAAAETEFIELDINAYLPSSTAIYFAGITSSTEIKMIFKRLYTTTLL